MHTVKSHPPNTGAYLNILGGIHPPTTPWIVNKRNRKFLDSSGLF